MMEQPFAFFSIVIPTYNRPERLEKCLHSITQLDYPRNYFEVIVVDDGSPTPMETVVEGFRNQLNLRLIRQTNSGPAKARNAGAAQAKGQFLVFTDDDCMPLPNWLSALNDRFRKLPEYLIGGRTLNALPDNIYSTASQMLIDYLYRYYNTEAGQSNFFASNNFAMMTERFCELGGFDTSFPLAAGEDREFCDRWLSHDYKMFFAPEVQIYHAHHLTLAHFWRQHFNYGRGAFCFHRVRAVRKQERIKVEPISFYSRLLAHPFSKSVSLSTVLIALLLLVSQIANVSGFFWARQHLPIKN